MDDKVIVTNLTALRQKYGSGLNKVLAAVRKLIAADKNIRCTGMVTGYTLLLLDWRLENEEC